MQDLKLQIDKKFDGSHTFTLHTNKDIDPKNLLEVDGVADVEKINRYQYTVFFGRLFDADKVFSAIETYLKSLECQQS